MRIALNGWFLDQPGTGSGQYLRGLLHALAAAEVDHEFLLVVPRAEPELDISLPKLHMLCFASRAWKSDLGKLLFEQVLFPWICRRWRADLAHVPYWASPLFPTVPTVVTVHDLIPLLLPEYRGGPLVRLYTALVAASARRADLVVTDSLASRGDILHRLRLPEGRVRCIYLAAAGAFQPEADAADAAIRARYNLPSRYVLYLAGHDTRKNVAGLLRAFSTVAGADSEVTLVVGGRLPQASGGQSVLRGASPMVDPRPLARELGLLNRVQFIGWVEEEDKPALYRGAACAVFVSRYEGFGLPVLEALACGTPLVASNASSLPELVGNAGFCLDPDDPKGIAGAILACLLDESLAAELRRRGPLQAARFQWSQTAWEVLRAYEEVHRQATGRRRDA